MTLQPGTYGTLLDRVRPADRPANSVIANEVPCETWHSNAKLRDGDFSA